MKLPKIQPRYWLWLAIFIYIAVFFGLCLYKYQHPLYNVEDLAIFNNILYNTARGKIFWFTVHGGFNYLGDHLEMGLLLLLPIYTFFQSPVTLLFAQVVLFALSAWPIYLIAQLILKKIEKYSSSSEKTIPLFLALIFLLSPFSQNVVLEEFHLAPLIIFFFLWTIYFYFKKDYTKFILFFILTLTLREDAAMSLGVLGLIALWDHRHNWWQKRKWWLYPILISIFYFFIALKLIAFFNPDGQYRFFILYNAKNIFNPLTWITSLFTIKNIWILVGYLMPFLFLLFRRPKYLLLLLPNLLQISLLNSGSTSLIFTIHHQIYILIALAVASVESLIYFLTEKKYSQYFWLIIFLVILGHFYTNFYFGPLQIFKPVHKNIVQTTEDLKTEEKILKLIPPQASLSSPYGFLPRLSSRPNIYVNRLTFLGKKHLALGDFILPSDVEYLLMDSADMLEYYLHFQNRKLYNPLYWDGAARMRAVVNSHNFQPISQTDSFILFKKDATSSPLPYQITDQLPQNLLGIKTDLGEINFLGYTVTDSQLNLWLNNKQKIADDYFLEITYLDKDQKNILQKIYPPAYGFLPTHDWPNDKFVSLTQTLLENSLIQSFRLQWIKIKGDIELGALNNVEMILDKKENLGPAIDIKL